MILTYPLRRLGGPVTPEIRDNPVHVPGTLQPIIELPGTLSSIVAADGITKGTPRQETIWVRDSFSFGASHGAGQNFLVTLSAGLWKIDGTLSTYANYNQATSNQITLLDPTGIISTLFIAAYPQNGSSQVHSRSIILNLIQDGWAFQDFAAATGVGQSMEVILSLLCSRLG